MRAFQGGCYDASRAAALSGVPKSTVYDWARKGIVVPSVSPEQEKLWSLADLMALRIVSWLRHRKPQGIPASPMPQVIQALDVLAAAGIRPWAEAEASPLVVESSGKVLVRLDGTLLDPVTKMNTLADPFDSFGLTEPFQLEGEQGPRGPDLRRPRKHLRILPGKVSGEPHVLGTRITTAALAGLAAEGYPAAQIAMMYDIEVGMVNEALSLEEQLGALHLAA